MITVVITLCIIGWPIVGLLGYIIIRKSFIKEFNLWTIRDRNVVIALCLVSAPIALVIGIAYYLQTFPDEPSSW